MKVSRTETLKAILKGRNPESLKCLVVNRAQEMSRAEDEMVKAFLPFVRAPFPCLANGLKGAGLGLNRVLWLRSRFGAVVLVSKA